MLEVPHIEFNLSVVGHQRVHNLVRKYRSLASQSRHVPTTNNQKIGEDSEFARQTYVKGQIQLEHKT